MDQYNNNRIEKLIFLIFFNDSKRLLIVTKEKIYATHCISSL